MSTNTLTPNRPIVNDALSKSETPTDAVDPLDRMAAIQEDDTISDSQEEGLSNDVVSTHDDPPDLFTLDVTVNAFGFDDWAQKYLGDRAVPLQFAHEQGFRTVGKKEAVTLGFPESIPSGGLLQTYTLHCLGDGVEQYRIQFSCPRDELGDWPKCLTLKGVPTVTWFPTTIVDVSYRNDTSQPICFAEGPVKAAAVTHAGYPCIGLAGVLAAWHPKGDLDSLSPELMLIQWAGQLVYVILDSNRATNPNVAFAEAKLAAVLRAAGAVVRVIELPAVKGQDGPDDFLHAQGVEAFKKLVNASVSSDPEARAKACKSKEEALALVGQFPFLAGLNAAGKKVELSIRNDWKNRLKVPNSAIKDAFDVYNAAKGEQAKRSGKPKAKNQTVNNQGADPIICNEETHVVESKILAALGMDPELYAYGGRLVAVRPPTKRQQTSTLRQVTPTVLAIRHMSKVATYVNSKGEKISPPVNIARSIIESWSTGPIREVLRIVNAPVMRPNGTVLNEPGYDEETGIILEPRVKVPRVPEYPTPEQVKEARDLLMEVIVNFPIVGSGGATWLAGPLSYFGLEMYEGPTPGFAFDGNIPGVGKSKIVQAQSMICLGTAVAGSSYVWDEVEIRKKVSTWLESGIGFVLVDNVPLRAELGNATWDALLTNVTWDDRRLGSNETISVLNRFIWTYSGNNIVVAKDTKRRLIHCRQETEREDPENRPRSDFLHPELLPWIQAERPQLVHAVLTVLRGWVVAGKPPGSMILGSFEGWSRVIGGVIEWLGLPNPIRTQQEYDDRVGSTGEAGALLVFLRAWVNVYGFESRTVREVLTLLGNEDAALKEAQRHVQMPKEDSDETIGLNEKNPDLVRPHQDLRDALVNLCGTRGDRLPDARSVGKVLAGYAKTPTGKLMLLSNMDSHTKVMNWRVERIDVNNRSGNSVTSSEPATAYQADSSLTDQLGVSSAGSAGSDSSSDPATVEPGLSIESSIAGFAGSEKVILEKSEDNQKSLSLSADGFGFARPIVTEPLQNPQTPQPSEQPKISKAMVAGSDSGSDPARPRRDPADPAPSTVNVAPLDSSRPVQSELTTTASCLDGSVTAPRPRSSRSSSTQTEQVEPLTDEYLAYIHMAAERARNENRLAKAARPHTEITAEELEDILSRPLPPGESTTVPELPEGLEFMGFI